MLFFSLRVAWFFTKNKEESETEQVGESFYRVKKDRRGDREEAQQLIASMNNAPEVLTGQKISDNIEGMPQN